MPSNEPDSLLDPEIYAFDPETAWKRHKIRKYKSDYLAVLANVSAWRERVAQETDKPRGRILKDDAIQEIAQQVVAVFGFDAFGMELNAVHLELAMLEAHDQPVV